MATVTTHYAGRPTEVATGKVDRVITILHWTYGIVPIVAGADKFANVLTDWSKYLAPIVTDVFPTTPQMFMTIVGVIEIIAGVIMLAKPRIGSLIVGAWLIGIAINLVMTGQYYDVAVRDIVMAIGAFSLYMLLGDQQKT